MTNKIIFIDCDDTLIYHGKHESYIPASAYEALHKLQKNGHIVSLSSGRSVFQVEQLMQELHIDNAVCFNGHMVISSDKVIYDDPLNSDEIQSVIDLLIADNKSIFAVDTEYMYINDPTDKIRYFILNKMRPGHSKSEASFIKQIKQIDKIARKYYFFMVFDYDLAGHAVCDHLRNMQLKHWEGYVYEIINKNTSKLSGVNVMLKHLNMNHCDCYAFGDSYNDIEMLQGVGCGIAMGNSPDALKEVADYVTTCVDEDGFYLACKKLRLID